MHCRREYVIWFATLMKVEDADGRAVFLLFISATKEPTLPTLP